MRAPRGWMTEAQPTHSFAALDAIAKSLLNSRAVIGRRASSRILSIVSIFEFVRIEQLGSYWRRNFIYQWKRRWVGGAEGLPERNKAFLCTCFAESPLIGHWPSEVSTWPGHFLYFESTCDAWCSRGTRPSAAILGPYTYAPRSSSYSFCASSLAYARGRER